MNTVNEYDCSHHGRKPDGEFLIRPAAIAPMAVRALVINDFIGVRHAPAFQARKNCIVTILHGPGSDAIDPTLCPVMRASTFEPRRPSLRASDINFQNPIGLSAFPGREGMVTI